MKVIDFKEQKRLNSQEFSASINNLLEKTDDSVDLATAIGVLEILKAQWLKGAEHLLRGDSK